MTKRVYAILAALALLGVAACNAGEVSQTQPAGISLSHASVYDPNVDATTGDNRPTAPSTNEVTPSDMNGGGNSGIVIPTGAGAGNMIGRR